MLNAILAKNGIDPSLVTIQPQQVSVTPFIDGQVDVITATRYNEYYTIKTRMGEEKCARSWPRTAASPSPVTR